MPSHRPHANTRHGSAARLAATAWVNGSPAGVGTTSRGGASVPAATSSSARPHTSGFITMPAPPPYGVSSTVRCTSAVQARRSWTRTSRSPRSRALPSRDTPSGWRYSGKIVTTSMRTAGAPLAARAEVEQALGRVDHDPPAGHVDLRHDLGHERHQRLTAAIAGDPQHGLPRQVQD